MNIESRILKLPCWKGKIDISSIIKGNTTQQLIVNDRNRKFFVRIGGNYKPNKIKRSNEILVSKAAAYLKISPDTIYNEKDLIVQKFIDGKTLNKKDLKNKKILKKIILIIKKYHTKIEKVLPVKIPSFDVFYIIKYYSKHIIDHDKSKSAIVYKLLNILKKCEKFIDKKNLILSHNDLISKNFIDDGKKIWIIDWEYTGYNNKFFDLANLSSYNNFNKKIDRLMLEFYFQEKLDKNILEQLNTIKFAAFVREVMWGMVAEFNASRRNVNYCRKYSNRYLKKIEEWKSNI